MTRAELVQVAIDCFIEDENGKAIGLKEDAPQWVLDLVDSIDTGVPHRPYEWDDDPYKYRLVRRALYRAKRANASADNIQTGEPHYSEFFHWVQSGLVRKKYANESIRKNRPSLVSINDFWHIMGDAYRIEARNIFRQVSKCIDNMYAPYPVNECYTSLEDGEGNPIVEGNIPTIGEDV